MSFLLIIRINRKYWGSFCPDLLPEIIIGNTIFWINVCTMCSKNMNDAKSFDEIEANDRSLRRSMPRYCRRAPGRQIHRVVTRLFLLYKLWAVSGLMSESVLWFGSFQVTNVVPGCPNVGGIGQSGSSSAWFCSIQIYILLHRVTMVNDFFSFLMKILSVGF